MEHPIKTIGDGVNLGTIGAWLLGIIPSLPEMAAFASLVYSCLRIYDWWKGRK